MVFGMGKLGQKITETAAEYAVGFIETMEAVVARAPDVVVREVEVKTPVGQGKIVYESVADPVAIAATKRAVREFASVAKGGIRRAVSSLWVPPPGLPESPLTQPKTVPGSPPMVKEAPSFVPRPPVQERASNLRRFAQVSEPPRGLLAINQGLMALVDATSSALEGSAKSIADQLLDSAWNIADKIPVRAIASYGVNYGLCKVGPKLPPPYRNYAVGACFLWGLWNSVDAVRDYRENQTLMNGVRVLLSGINLMEGINNFGGLEGGMGASSQGTPPPSDPGAPGQELAGLSKDAVDTGIGGDGATMAQALGGAVRELFTDDRAAGSRFLSWVEARVANDLGSLDLAEVDAASFGARLQRWFNEMESQGLFASYPDDQLDALDRIVRYDPGQVIKILEGRQASTVLGEFFAGLRASPLPVVGGYGGQIVTSSGVWEGNQIAGEIGASLSVNGDKIR